MFSGLSVVQPSARRWTALASFALQVGIVAAVLILPMLYPQDLPQVFLTRRIFVPMSKGEVRVDPRQSGSGSGGSVHAAALVVSRERITFGKRLAGSDTGSPEAPSLGIEGAGVQDPGFIGSEPLPLPTRPKPSSIRTSVVMAGNLIRRVEPQYPAIARQIRLEGTVVLKAVISRDGDIEQIQVTSGPGLLAGAAATAVRQWKYRPYLLNGEPVEVETQITVKFLLGH